MPDRYTYPDSEVLRNFDGITDPHLAHDLETGFAYQRLVELARHPIEGSFDLAHLQAIHRHVYQDLWEWAGEIRTTDTGAVGTGLAHCRPEFIQEQARVIFGAIERDNALKGMDQATFTARLADHWGEITALHPFRDGNTRAQRAYFDQMSREADWSIDWQMINRDIRSFVDARVHAHATADSRPLRDVLALTIRPAEAVISFPRSTDAFAHEPLPQPAPEVHEDPQ